MKRIDVHHHVFPERYIRALKGAGVENSMGVRIVHFYSEDRGS